MNIITSNYAVSVFPLSTFVHRYSFIVRPRNSQDWKKEYNDLGSKDVSKVEKLSQPPIWKKKYEDRGFRLIGDNKISSRRNLPSGQRHVMDKKCWIIKFKGMDAIHKPI